MKLSGNKRWGRKPAGSVADENQQYAWRERSYVVPRPSKKGFRWKVSALRGLQRLNKAQTSAQPVTIVVPALFNLMPAETLALGWLNEIDALGKIRQRIATAAKLTGWDVFTFHTRHNLDSYFASTISAVRDTWLKEGSLNRNFIAETTKRYGAAYHYHSIPARLVENLVFQSSLMEWVTTHAPETPLTYHVVGTGLLSALVWSGSVSFENAINVALDAGGQWDDSFCRMATAEIERKGREKSDENIGWLYFDRVRQVLEGRTVIALGATLYAMPVVEAPSRPFWYSVTAADEPVLLKTARDIQWSLESLNFASWSPRIPRPLPSGNGDVKGWLASPQHAMASECRWSVRNYLLSTPDTASLFLEHIATRGGIPMAAPQSEAFQERLRLSKIKVTGP